MNSKKLRRITLSAVFAALTCVATMLIRIPTPTKGYVNLGDCLVNVSAWVLGPAYGAASSGIGSALADLFAGYAVYAAATLVIKGAMAGVSYGVYRLISGKTHGLRGRIVGAIAAELIMIIGYFTFEAVLYGSVATASLGLAGNIAQGIMGAVSSVVIYEAVIKKIPRSI